jgi:hypothetical protein
VLVVYAADCGEDGNCPVCKVDYADCACPGPTMEEYEYRWEGGVLWARERLGSDEGGRQG